jgi:cytoskeletal protein CcmA (bactofilin family)
MPYLIAGLKFFVVAALVLGSFDPVEASSVVRSGETVTIAADQEVAGDFYGMGGTVAISGLIGEDLVLAGGSIALNGTIGADALLAAGEVDINGVVKDDVRIVSGRVTVAGEVTGDLVVFASELKVLSTATIGGDILFYGDYAEISGVIGKDILGTSNRLRIDGEVLGGLNVTSGALTLGDKAAIAKNVVYSSATDLVRAQNATVEGEVVRNSVTTNEVNPLKFLLIPLFIVLFSTFVWLLLFRRSVEKVVGSIQARPVMVGLIGFGAFFLLPISAGILLASTLGMILGGTLLLFFMLAVLISISLVGIVIGALLRKSFLKKSDITLPFSALGVLLFGLVFLIPM